MKKEIIYCTMTGHSKKIANAIGKELNITPKNVLDSPTLQDVDILFIVGGIYDKKSSPKLIEYLNGVSKENIKKVFLITSSCYGKTGASEVRELLSKKGIKVSDKEFTCRGGFLFFYMFRPNKNDLNSAIDFAKRAKN